MDPTTKQQVVDRLREATNVLVTVSNNPSVDQLAACIGLSLFLNKVDRRGTAIFSGKVPSTLEFLKPEKTLEKNTDSLRDFIISLDKSKADKLRYKVEDQVVKIFITPYRTNLSGKDLDFSQGDFNIDVVIVLGVQQRDELDQAITAHGRILHDATVISVNNKQQGDLGSINWVNLEASSLCEMVVDLADEFGKDNFDNQIAAALLTGIVAETNRFSNEKTTPRTMSLASQLMAAGANQQLIATNLEQPLPGSVGNTKRGKDTPDETKNDSKKNTRKDDGSLKIDHIGPDESEDAKSTENDNKESDKQDKAPEEPKKEEPEPAPEPSEELPKPINDNKGSGRTSGMILEPPTLGGKLTANTEPEHMQMEPATDILGGHPSGSRILNRKPIGPPTAPKTTLEETEDNLPGVHHISQPDGSVKPALPQEKFAESTKEEPRGKPANKESSKPETEDTLEEAREAVTEAIETDPSQRLEPVQSLGAQNVDLDLDHPQEGSTKPDTPPQPPTTLAPKQPKAPRFGPPPTPMVSPSMPPTSTLPGPTVPPLSPAPPSDQPPGSTNMPPPPVPSPMMPPPTVR